MRFRHASEATDTEISLLLVHLAARNQHWCSSMEFGYSARSPRDGLQRAPVEMGAIQVHYGDSVWS